MHDQLLDSECLIRLRKTRSAVQNSENAGAKSKVEGRVKFDEVVFQRLKEPPILRHVTFKVAAGQTAAIVGPTGHGKSTISLLLGGLIHASTSEGGVYIDDHDVRSGKLPNSIG